MAGELKLQTVTEITFGPFLDATTFLPLAAIAAPTAARVWKEGVTSTIDLSTGRTPAWTHDGDGFYSVGTLATDVDQPGRLKIDISDGATHLPVWENWAVVNTLSAVDGATLANQQELLTRTASGVEIISPVTLDGGQIDLFLDDEYDGVASPLLSFTVEKDYSSATSVKLVMWINGKPGMVIKTSTAVVASATSITVALTATFSQTLIYTGTPSTSKHEFALIATWPTDKPETAKQGELIVTKRGTPA